jgi:hypothetical protein
MGGIPLTVFVVVRLVKAAARLSTPWRPVEAWLAAYLLGIFAFEAHFLQVSIQLLTLWLVIAPLRSFRRQTSPHTEAPVHLLLAERMTVSPTTRDLTK